MTTPHSFRTISFPLLAGGTLIFWQATASAQAGSPSVAPPSVTPPAAAPPSVTPPAVAKKAAAEKVAADKKAAAEKVAADKKAAAEKVAAERKALVDKAASDKAAAAKAAAAGTKVVTLADLDAGSLEVDAPPTLPNPAPLDRCQVSGTLSSDKVKLTLDLGQLGAATGNTCGQLINASPTAMNVAVMITGTTDHALLTLKPIAVSKGAPIKLILTGDEVAPVGGTFTAAAGVEPTLYWLKDKKWHKVAAENNKLTLPPELKAEVLASTSGPYSGIFVNFTGTGAVAPGTESRGEISASGAGDTAPPVDTPPADWCKRNPMGYTVCLDFYDNALSRKKRRIQVFPNDTNHILAPNTSIRVVVLRRKSAIASMDLGGEEGVFTSKDRDLTQPSGIALQSKLAGYDIDDQEFAPRLPGNANLTVTVTDGGKSEVRTVEFVVETTYIGAVRIGAAMVFNATDRAYEARAVAGSKQSEIAVTKKSAQDIELVLGYSAYLSPRGYANTSWTNFEPYVGIGVLNQGPTALETLKSLHFGLEWEPSANFGVAFTGVVRRVQRLADGYNIQSPISGAVPTVEKAEVGFGIVFNLSPDFLRIAKQSGSTFFK